MENRVIPKKQPVAIEDKEITVLADLGKIIIEFPFLPSDRVLGEGA